MNKLNMGFADWSKFFSMPFLCLQNISVTESHIHHLHTIIFICTKISTTLKMLTCSSLFHSLCCSTTVMHTLILFSCSRVQHLSGNNQDTQSWTAIVFLLIVTVDFSQTICTLSQRVFFPLVLSWCSWAVPWIVNSLPIFAIYLTIGMINHWPTVCTFT